MRRALVTCRDFVQQPRAASFTGPRWGSVAPSAGWSYASPVRLRDWWGMTLRTRLVAVTLLLAFSLASCGGDNSTQQGSQKPKSDTTTSAEVSSCACDADVPVPEAEFQEAACLTDLTTRGTQESGHTKPKDWAGLNAKETDNPSGVSGLQIDGYFPDDSRTNTNNGHDHDSQFVLRLPDE